MPEFIFCLEANDEFLRNRVMNLPESVVHGTHNTETELNRRLTQYRNNNDEENTVLTYFDEREIDPIKIDVTKDSCVVFGQSLFVYFSFFLWQLHCLLFFNLQLLITLSVSSNFS
jgi:adenylate kinase